MNNVSLLENMPSVKFSFATKFRYKMDKKIRKKILNETGFSNISQTQTFETIEWLKQSIKQRLLDQFLQEWNSPVHNSQKAFNYRIIEFDFKFEENFNIIDEQNSLLLCKFRAILIINCPSKREGVVIIFTGKTDIASFVIYVCQKNQIGDKYHYIFELIKAKNTNHYF